MSQGDINRRAFIDGLTGVVAGTWLAANLPVLRAVAGNPFESWRSRGYPLPPLPIKSEGVLCERGAKKLGWHPWPAPMAILSRRYQGRSACVHCGLCSGYGCEVQAKSSTLVTMIPEAIATGRCEVRADSFVHTIELNSNGRVTGAAYFNKEGSSVSQRAKAVILSANGFESPRLLLLSTSNRFPKGLANSSGQVGRNFMAGGNGGASGMFDHDIMGWKGVAVSRILWDFYQVPPATGLYGGGGIDMRSATEGPRTADVGWPAGPRWGREWKQRARDKFNRTVSAGAPCSQLPVAENRVELHPTAKDKWGLPVRRVTMKAHPQDITLAKWLGERCRDLLVAAGASQVSESMGGVGIGYQLLGTCRMGKDPGTSVVNADHRTHDVRNLFVVDGSNFVTSGRGQPTMTIQALAFRAADRIRQLAKAGAI